jgi:hypothetical protein
LSQHGVAIVGQFGLPLFLGFLDIEGHCINVMAHTATTD